MNAKTISAAYAADFTVAQVFSDHMVLQRNEPIRVWGFAPAAENGKKVSGEFKGMLAEALIENGEWCITFEAELPADTVGADMRIYTDTKTVTFTDVLVGDVYLVLGQSNAYYTIRDHITDARGEAADYIHPEDIDPDSIIRLNNLSEAMGDYPDKGNAHVCPDLRNKIFWQKTTPRAVLRFSALGYFYAAKMTAKDPTVPIGLMEVAYGGAPIVSFLPNALAEQYGGDYWDKDDKVFYSNINTEHMGRYLYNCYLAPVSRYAIAGVLWYQGESNNQMQEASEFNETFVALINHMRSTHNLVHKNFPVFIVEFPSIYTKPEGFTEQWHFMELGMIRAYMGSIPSMLENSYTVVSSDIWKDRTFYNNLHPYCKFEQADKIVALADVVINRKGCLEEATGPVLKSATVSRDQKTVEVTFTNVGEGLSTADGGSAVKGVIGLLSSTMGHSPVTPVSVEITAKDRITAYFDTEVKAVAYNYDNEDHYGETINLCNSFGRPAAAFITPYADPDLTGVQVGDLISLKDERLGLVGCSFDFISAGAKTLVFFDIDDSTAVDVDLGTTDLGFAGWLGYSHDILTFGYSIDGGELIYKSLPSAPMQDVIDAGGPLAKRFRFHINIKDLSIGEHTVTISAYVNLNGGTGVRLVTFKINIKE